MTTTVAHTNSIRCFAKESTWLNGIETGWGNGYVVVPDGHPMHGADYDDVDVSVHGGLTFASSVGAVSGWPEVLSEDGGGWIFGFDTAHPGDSRAKWPDEPSVLAEAEHLKNQLETLGFNDKRK